MLEFAEIYITLEGAGEEAPSGISGTSIKELYG